MPTFSIIIPTRNRPRLLRQCVDSVLSQTVPRSDYEVIVVDDGSRGATRECLEDRVSAGEVAYLRQRQQGWSQARRAGAAVSRGDILVFLDDDCAAPPDWLATCADLYARAPEKDGVAGGLLPGARTNVAGYKLYAGHRRYFDRLNESLGTTFDGEGRCWFSFGGNRSFRRDVWLAAQPAEPRWYFDDFLIDVRLRERDCFVYYSARAAVRHDYHLTFGQRLRAAYRYGRSAGQQNAASRAVAAATRPANRGGFWLADLPPSPAWLGLAWYVMTQPLVRLAARAGRALSA